MQQIREDHQFVLRLDPGEEIFESITGLARTEQLRAGLITFGIGMLDPTRLGYWNGREYVPKELNRPHELVGLHGTLAEADGIPSVHLHAALAGPDHALVGGHLMSGRVSVLAEIHLVSCPARRWARPIDESIGLRRLDLCPGPGGP